MKISKLFICGITVGLVMAMGFSAFGAPISEKISSYINHTFKFEFDGVQKDLPNGYHVLVYEGRSYVPARFIAENLGATVDWNDETKIISIHSPEPVTVTVPAISAQEDKDQTPAKEDTAKKESYDYKSLPQTKEFYGYRISPVLYKTDTQNIGDYLYLTITNTGRESIKLVQMETKLLADGESYTMPGKHAINLDPKWYSYIRTDETMEGYLRLPFHSKDLKTLHVELTIEIIEDFKTIYEVATFDIAL